MKNLWTIIALCTASVSADAALLSRLDGQAYYDTVLDVTWLADANLAATNTFGIGGINSIGGMTWDTAHSWIAAMSAAGGAGFLGVNDWRLPTVSPVNGSTFNIDTTNNGTTDAGHGATGIGWQTAAGAVVSEMGYVYYANLGNLGFCKPDDAAPASCVAQPDFGLVNTGPFSNIQTITFYWSGVVPDPDGALGFTFYEGRQDNYDRTYNISFVWPVRSGDVGEVPAPAASWLFGTGIAALIVRARRRA